MSDLISKTSVCEILADIYPTDGEKVVDVKKIDKAYEAVQNLSSAQQWIPCNKQLPEFGVKALVHNTNNDIYSDYIIETPHGKKIWCNSTAYDVYDVVAWMPLPPIYKGE